MEYKDINEIDNAIKSKKILQFMLLHSNVTLILLKKRCGIQFEFDTFNCCCMSFNYFTIKLHYYSLFYSLLHAGFLATKKNLFILALPTQLSSCF